MSSHGGESNRPIDAAREWMSDPKSHKRGCGKFDKFKGRGRCCDCGLDAALANFESAIETREHYAERGEERIRQLIERVEEVHAEKQPLRDVICGFLWMLDEHILVRSVIDDHSEGWMLKSVRFAQWISDAVEKSDREAS